MKTKRLLFGLVLSAIFAGGAYAQAQSWKALPTDDTYCKGSKQDAPSGEEAIIHLKNSQYGDVRRDGFMRFDLSECNVEFPAASVKVYLYVQPGDLPYEFPGFFCYKLNGYENSDWDEATLVSANRPTGFNTGRFTSPDLILYWDLIAYIDDAEEQYYPMDITEYANAVKASGSNDINFIIRGDAAAGASGEIQIPSKEEADENKRPYIEVLAGSTGMDSSRNEEIRVIAKDGYITLENVSEGASVELVSVNGVTQLRGEYSAPMNVAGFSGVYILKIQKEGIVINKKVIL